MILSSFDERFNDFRIANEEYLDGPVVSVDKLEAFIKSELDKRDGEWTKRIENQPVTTITESKPNGEWEARAFINRQDLLRSKT